MAEAKPIVPRKMHFDFDPDTIPKWWLANNPVITHFSNGLHLLFPEGERFFIRSVKYYLDEIEDPELKERARNFFLQEAQHGRQHALSFEMLQRQGYDVAKELHHYEKVRMPWVERTLPPIMRLSVTVALEHLTAALGENAFVDGFLADNAHPTMKALLQWHAAEEIEHKSVAFDVLKAVNPSYFIRILGMIFAFFGLLSFSGRFVKKLVAQERLPKAELDAYIAEGKKRRRQIFRPLLRKAVLEYLRPSFHPDDNDNYHLASDYLMSIGRLEA